MEYLTGLDYWQGGGLSRTRLVQAPVNKPVDLQNLGSGFLGGNNLEYISFQPPLTFLQIASIYNFNLSTQGGIPVNNNQVINPAFNNTVNTGG